MTTSSTISISPQPAKRLMGICASRSASQSPGTKWRRCAAACRPWSGPSMCLRSDRVERVAGVDSQLFHVAEEERPPVCSTSPANAPATARQSRNGQLIVAAAAVVVDLPAWLQCVTRYHRRRLCCRGMACCSSQVNCWRLARRRVPHPEGVEIRHSLKSGNNSQTHQTPRSPGRRCLNAVGPVAPLSVRLTMWN